MTYLRSSLLAISLAASTYASPLSTYHQNPASRGYVGQAPLHEASNGHGHINSSYIVVLKDGLSDALVANHYNLLQTAHFDNAEPEHTGVGHVYDTHFKGYSGSFSDATVEQLRQQPEVDYIERDQVVKIVKENTSQQNGAPWGLARISHRKKLGFGTFTKYPFISSGGQGVVAYVIDTGVHITHNSFEGRAAWGKTIPQNDVDKDANGHGTHCAGTIASAKYGVAKKAQIVAVKVLGSDGSGSMSDVVAGVEWASNDAQKRAKAAREARAKGEKSAAAAHKGSVANMSLGGGKSRALDQVVNAAVDSGLHFAVAAGNENQDACSTSPAGAEKPITVGASTLGDDRAYFSNHGKCVDVFAPGLNILSTWNTGNDSSNTISGTSMASPHVCGLLAYFLSIYPSETFNPVVTKDFSLDFSLGSQRTLSTSSIYAIAHASLPRFVTAFLPDPSFFEDVAPTPTPTITTTQMKKAVLDLATKGALKDLPPNTVNLLIFNNVTGAL